MRFTAGITRRVNTQTRWQAAPCAGAGTTQAWTLLPLLCTWCVACQTASLLMSPVKSLAISDLIRPHSTMLCRLVYSLTHLRLSACLWCHEGVVHLLEHLDTSSQKHSAIARVVWDRVTPTPVRFRQSVAQSVSQIHQVAWQVLRQSYPILPRGPYTSEDTV